ncbi:discoidin domain-containing protein [Luteolibacter pohnpeiensis]|nr:discoidin domain-containing protein [Luteolibacter pohnpeiensis]
MDHLKINRLLANLAVQVIAGAIWVARAAPLPEGKSRHVDYPEVRQASEGLSWPVGQAIPIFATPAKSLDAIAAQDLSRDELITFSALQGQVNKKQPRIYLFDARAEEKPETWPDTAGFALDPKYDRNTKLDLVDKYKREIAGVVLYDPNLNPHYRNLAGTAAAVMNAIPVTQVVYDDLKNHGIRFKVVEDLTKLDLKSTVEIYEYLYQHYWPKCEKRLIVSAKPLDRKGGGDYFHTRDIASAAGAAVVWLDTTVPEERKMLGKFFNDMKAGESIALGWYATERSGITAASEYGIGTLPADFFISASVFAGTTHEIKIPPVPKMPELKDKVYIAIFISDGDNIQYTQHAMRKNWDRSADVRGKMPLNWTISPGLVDIAPVIMNYYYGQASPLDCFVTGPSGMGYMMPFNTLNEPGAPVGDYLKDKQRMDGYARLTETYLQRSGLRVSTIWDDATTMQRDSYETFCRSLYGATVQNFKDVPSVEGGVTNRRVLFDKLKIPYAGSYDHISGSIHQEIQRWDGKSPKFIAYQADVWGDLSLQKLIQLHDRLNEEFPDKVEFVRADHYFNLSNEAGGIPYNLCLDANTQIRTSSDTKDVNGIMDGTVDTMWTSKGVDKPWIGLDFQKPHVISRYVIRHAGAAGLAKNLNTKAFMVQTSLDGNIWTTVDAQKANTADVTDIEFAPVNARYLKVTIYDSGKDSTARVAELEVFGH